MLAFALSPPAVAAFALYFPTLGIPFIGDDYGLLADFHNRVGVRDLVAAVAHMFVSGVGLPSNQYRPLTMLSFAVNDIISGADAAPWRLTNIGLHAANAMLVALVAWQITRDAGRRALAVGLAAGMMFALFPPATEAVTWIAARFDGMALVWILVAVSAFLASQRRFDNFFLASLAATVLAFMSKESAALVLVLIPPLAWWKKRGDERTWRRLVAALVDSSPWLLVAAAYFLFRLWIFGDPFRFYPGTSPLHALVAGEWLRSLLTIGDWWSAAAPEPVPRTAFAVCLALLTVLVGATALRERRWRTALFVLAVATVGALAMLLAHWRWVSGGEGGRVLYPIWAIATLLLVLPLAASGTFLRAAGWVAAVGLIVSETSLAQAAIDRWIEAGRDMRALIAAMAQVAVDAQPSGYAFVVVPDRIGPIPFARNAQGGLLSPPTQQRPLSPWLMVQTPEELDRWPDLFARDVIGRLRREPLAAVAANLLTPKVPAPHALPDRYYCWSPRAHALMPLALPFAADLSDWSVRWRQAMPVAGCLGDAPV